MTDVSADEPIEKKGSGKLGLILGLVLAVAGGGVGFFVTTQGYFPILSEEAKTEEKSVTKTSPLQDFAFVDLPTLLVSIDSGGEIKHLRFTAKLEVDEQYQAEVERAMPRIVDVMNGYLRAVEPGDLMEPTALIRLRGHMLRRVNIVTGEGLVNDLLVMEFVLN